MEHRHSSTYNHHTNFCTRFLCLSHNAGVEVTSWYTVVRRCLTLYYGISRSNFYPGVVTQTKKSGAEVSVMVVSGTNWKWYKQEEKLFYYFRDIMMCINKPVPIGKRGVFRVAEMYLFRSAVGTL